MLAHYGSMLVVNPENNASVVASAQPSPIRSAKGSELFTQSVKKEASCVDSNYSGSCEHLEVLKKGKGEAYLHEQYSIIVQHFVACCSAPDRRRRAYSGVCGVCRERNRLHVCLLCVHLACHSPTRSHIFAHSNTSDHPITVDLSYGQLLCVHCQDYIYDAGFAKILHRLSNNARQDIGLPAVPHPWEPSKEEIEILKQNPKRRKISSTLTVGLRGLVNLGNTCFMSSILQALVHTPVIRNYSLSENHRCGQDSPACCFCEVRSIIQEFYSGNQQPFIPSRLLHLVWKNAKHLAGYEQQDAHEFFISLLDIMHTHLVRSNNSEDTQAPSSSNSNSSSSSSAPTTNCPCIIHKVFTGQLQSDITCQRCNKSRTTTDPFWDISLDLHNENGSQLTLIDCLRRFTKPEKLTGAKIECNECHAFEEDMWSKQLTFKQLPIVLSFHLKRFHGNANGSHRKISDPVSFPTDLDLKPFITTTAAISSTSSECSSTSSSTAPPPPPTQLTPAAEALSNYSYSYSLFAVVSHTGPAIDKGHYVSYIRQNNDWFKCDDHLVTPVKVDDVLQADGYVLFYTKKNIDYS